MSSRFLDYLLLGLGSVWRQKLRSALTALGIILGIAALLSMLAVGEGARREILSEMERLGLRNIVLRTRKPQTELASRSTGQRSRIEKYGLLFTDLDRIEDAVAGLVRSLPVHDVGAVVKLEGRRVNAVVHGVTVDYFETFPTEVLRGRNLCDLDRDRLSRVCVLEAPLPTGLLRGRDPIGALVGIGDFPFRVVGVVRRRNGPDGDGDRRVTIYMPYETALSAFGTTTIKFEDGKREFFDVELDAIVLECEEPLAVLAPVERLLEKFHERGDYEIDVPLRLLQQKQRTQDIFNTVMLIIAGLTLVVGGVGVVNIMLVSVAERTREIGVRRAMGARRRDIMLQFLIETAALTLGGGVLGVLVGFCGVYATEQSTGWPVSVTPWAVAGSLLTAVGAGLIFGLYPARRAASIRPMEALRSD